MDWDKLREEKCPRCSEQLHKAGILDAVRMCSGSHCLFKISIEKFEKIVYQTKRNSFFDPEPNLSELNNLKL